jgi:phospholipid N-methyltransferase
MDKSVKFLKNAISGEKVGALSRSSKFVINEVLKNVESNLDTVIEYGPGDGVLTVELLKRLSPKGKLLVVELDTNFVNELKKIKDDRLIVIKGQMEEISSQISKYGMDNADIVVSSIPFSFIKKSEREMVVKNTEEVLKKGGKFIIFHQYSLIMSKILKKYFSSVTNHFEPRNFFPCFIMVAKKF